MVISAPTTTALPGSMMRPVTEALVLCADNTVLLQRRQAEEKRARMILLLIFNYKLIQLLNSRREPRRHLPQRAQNSSLSRTATQGWLGGVRRDANRSCLPLGFCSPPLGSTVTNMASISFKILGSSKRKVQRLLAALSR